MTELAAQVRLLLMDVDGVLTDGKLLNVPDASRQYGRDQGLRFAGWHQPAVDELEGHRHRADQRARIAGHRGAREAMQVHATSTRGTSRRSRSWRRSWRDAGVTKAQVAYIGDDLTDVVVMHRVGLAIATANARPEVKAQAHYVTAAPGGSGAVREVVELILKAQGYWDEILRKYEVL